MTVPRIAALALCFASACSDFLGPSLAPMTITVLDDVVVPEIVEAGDTLSPGVVATNDHVRFRVSVRIENKSDFDLSLPPCVHYALQRADGVGAIQYSFASVNCAQGVLPARAVVEDQIEWTACTNAPSHCFATWALGNSITGAYRVGTAVGRADGGPSRDPYVHVRSNSFMALWNELNAAIRSRQ
jgi:hypothetical protein